MESIIKKSGNCGLFQLVFGICASFPKTLFALFMVFSSFGNYNPGWRCLDSINGTDHETFNMTTLGQSNDTEPTYSVGNCDLYKKCRKVEYNPEASTIITEWDLSCDRAWIAPSITSTQMVGVLVGSFFTGFLGDRFGRKVTLIGAILANTILSIVTIFSISWPMFMVLKFVGGLLNSTYRFLPTVYCTEFVPIKWRVIVAGFPFYTLGTVIFGIFAMITKDWRQIQIATACTSAFGFIIMLWLPRSVRWLATHDRKREAFQAANKIAKLNRKPAHSEETINNLITNINKEVDVTKKYSTKELFRKGVRLFTFIISAEYFTTGVTLYMIVFSVKALPGNLYTNLVLVGCASLCSNTLLSCVGSKLGRRTSFLLSHLATAASLFGVAIIILGIDDKEDKKWILVMALVARCISPSIFIIMTTLMNELYPTVIRSNITGWASFAMQAGACIAPFLVPKESDLLYISYLIMGGLTVLCSLFYFLIPETSTINLKDTFAEVDKEAERKKTLIRNEDVERNTGVISNTEVMECLQSPYPTVVMPIPIK